MLIGLRVSDLLLYELTCACRLQGVTVAEGDWILDGKD